MWNIFKNKYNLLSQSKQTYQDDVQKRYRELKQSFEQNLKQLTKNIATSEQFFTTKYLVNSKEQSLARTFQEMMATLEGLIAIIIQLKTQYDESQLIVKQYKQIKNMISNHHNIINSIQQSHSDQVTQIYEQKKMSQDLLNQTIKQLNSQKLLQEQKILNLHSKIQESHKQNKILLSQNQKLRLENEQLQKQLQQIELKYDHLTSESKKIENKNIINFQHIKLQYTFYYAKLRDQMISFLQVKDIFNLERVNRFFRTSLHREESRHIYQNLRRRYKKIVENEVKTAKFYQKIYQTFPMQNIKICAFKYLYFKIRPASYILPYLQQQNQFETIKIDQQIKNPKEQPNKFNWKQFFTSDKNNKTEKKEENQNKFSLSQFKNQQDYRKVQVKIENSFKNIFPIKMPEDFKYFTQTMQKQLQQLKQSIGHYKSSKGPMQWTAQLHCLTKYMYLQINQLYNLLQVLFGQLLTKTKDLITTRQGYDYLHQNEIVLRNLIENLSNDKSSIERKYIILENQILKKKLQNQAVWNKYHQIQCQYQKYKERHQQIAIQYADTKKLLQKFQDQRKQIQYNMTKIREQVQALEKNPGRQRRLSIGSVNSDQQGMSNQNSLY